MAEMMKRMKKMGNRGLFGGSHCTPFRVQSLKEAGANLLFDKFSDLPEDLKWIPEVHSTPNPAVAKKLLTEIEEQKFTLISDMANDPEISNIVLEKKPSLMRNSFTIAAVISAIAFSFLNKIFVLCFIKQWRQ